MTGVTAQPAAQLSSPSEPLLGPAAPPLPCCTGVEPPGPALLAPPYQHPRAPALSLSPCLMEDDIIMLHGVATNVATEGSIKSIKWSQSIAGLTASACAAFILVVSISRCFTYPTTLSPIPCRQPWNEVSRAERPQWSPKVAAKTAKTWAVVSASPAAWVSTSLLGRSLQCLDQPLHCCPILHLEVPEDALCLLNKFIGVAAIRLSSEAW